MDLDLTDPGFPPCPATTPCMLLRRDSNCAAPPGEPCARYRGWGGPGGRRILPGCTSMSLMSRSVHRSIDVHPVGSDVTIDLWGGRHQTLLAYVLLSYVRYYSQSQEETRSENAKYRIVCPLAICGQDRGQRRMRPRDRCSKFFQPYLRV